MSILESIGTSTKAYEEATGASVSATFEPLASGVYKGTIKAIMVYKNEKFNNTQMKYIVNITDGDRDIEFRSDVGNKLKDNTDNLRYASRLKQFAYAAGVSLESLSMAPTTTKHKMFGKDVDVTLVQGMTGKSILALVRLSEDPDKKDGEPYQFRNDIEGVCATNGTDSSGENAKETFEAKIEKTPTFKLKSKLAKTGQADATASTPEAKASMSNLI